MKSKRFFLLALIFVISAAGIYQDKLHAQIITVEKAVELAVSENLGLKAENYSLSAKRRSMANRWNAFLPDISLSSGMSRTNEPPASPLSDHHWNLSWRFSAQLNLSAALFDGIKYLLLDYESGLLSYEDAQKALVRDVKKSFYSLILLQESIKLINQNIETAEKRYIQAELNFNSGLVSELDKLQALVTLESLKPQWIELNNRYNSSLLSFKQMLGLENETAIALQGEIEPEEYEIEVNELVFKSLSHRLDIQQMVQKIKILETDLGGAKNSRLPALILGYTKDMRFTEDPFAHSVFKERDQTWYDQGAFSLTLSIALDSFIPGSGTDTGIKNRQDSIRALESQLSQALRMADIEIRTIVMRLENSIQKLQALEYSRMLAQRAYELAEEGYNSGTVEILAFQSTDDRLQEANLKIAEEKYNYKIALLDLEYSLNKTLEEIYAQKE